MMNPASETAPDTPTPAAPDAPASGEASSATATAPARPPRRRPNRTPPTPATLPPFRVLLHNDRVNDADFVVETLLELTPLKLDRAVDVMLEAHNTGVSLVLVTHRERAELYSEQFASKRLTVTIEPAE